jgi:hypothetical protein
MDVVRAMDPSLSTKDAVMSLCLTQCDITEMLQQSATRSSPGDLFMRAAVAARHPLPAALSRCFTSSWRRTPASWTACAL